MSIDIDWTTLTSGDDGAALAESIRAFIHERFQQVTLPRFIRSVKVHSFDFGSVAPELELKDVCDPLPDFYDDDDDDDDDEAVQFEDDANEALNSQPDEILRRDLRTGEADKSTMPPPPVPPRAKAAKKSPPQLLNLAALQSLQQAHSLPQSQPPQRSQSPVPNQSSTPGIPGGTSNFSYFHMQPLSAGMSGHTTPLAAVAPHHFVEHWNSQLQSPWPPTSAVNSAAQPFSPSQRFPPPLSSPSSPPPSHSPGERENGPTPNDIQTVFHLRYDGNLSLSLTADILLDYPTTSFVSIPLQLNVTGLSFDGVAILAYIRQKAHFCFLAPDDANALVGGGNVSPSSGSSSRSPSPSAEEGETHHSTASTAPELKLTSKPKPKANSKPEQGTLFDSIRVESEIGQRAPSSSFSLSSFSTSTASTLASASGSSSSTIDTAAAGGGAGGGTGGGAASKGGSSLKNIGKVEAFVLEQVRRLFEAELVYPSFWTFLV